MMRQILTQRFYLVPLLALAVLAHVGLMLDLPLIWRAGAALIITGLTPGMLLVEWLLGDDAERQPELWERVLYGVGAGYALMVVVLLLLSYWPGPLHRWQTLVAFDLLNASLAFLIWRQGRTLPQSAPGVPGVTQTRDVDRRWLVAGLLSLALVAGFFRFPNLSYSEFQGDEARAVLIAAQNIQGYTEALLTHKKGPAEILVPTAIYSLTDRLNEASARLPFAIANFAALFAIFLLGWRLFGPVGGWTAAILLALDGYLIGFSRIVQYQSLVFFMVVLTVLVLHRLVRHPAGLGRYLTLAALFLATGLLAHYEAALAALPGLYLLYTLWRQGQPLPRLVRSLGVPVLVGGTVLAIFYVPFVLNPSFRITYAYITVNRIGTSFPYNNLVDFFERSTLYSSTYYFVLMAGLATLGLAHLYRRNWPDWRGWLATALLVGGVTLTFWVPNWLTVAGQDHTWLFFAAVLAAAWFLPRFPMEERLVWLWFGAPMVLMLFFTLTPNTHVYGFVIPWGLVAGMVLARAWAWLRNRLTIPAARRVAVPTMALAIALFGNYEYWYFVHTGVEVLRTWRENRPWGYWFSYDMPTRMSIFGFPLRNGWKVVGSLYAEGVLDAPFDLNGKEPVADWYTRGQGRCPRDHVYYIFTQSVEPADKGYLTVIRQQVEEQGYQKYGVVMVNGEERLTIYKMADEPITPQVFQVDDFETRFDENLSGPHFELSGPVAEPAIQHPLDYRFGDAIRLQGYRLNSTQATPDGALSLTLYWQATQPVETKYSVFTQIIDMGDFHKVGQRDGEPGCNEFPTTFWRPGDTIADRYFIPVYADARPGTYTLLIGMYDGDTGERLPIFDGEGQPIGDALGLTEIQVLPAP
ncbi:glycosyltransferase family 39 protein [Litorilinea aerophila]|nr:glycosyltransferase family 39 protein [Litorilinea aerophila]MCC9074530.1 glycosyltransferase family 39 protein [Litorilinea aerophila]GIV75677.1 MAG: hypothetical protein KatS3mg050_0071 [Litorilinea sp.]